MSAVENEMKAAAVSEEQRAEKGSSNKSGVQCGARVVALLATVSAAIVMGTNNQARTLFGVGIDAKSRYLPAFTFFVTANSVVASYVALTGVLFLLRRFHRARTLVVPDLLASVLLSAAASAATAVAYIGERGNSHAMWQPICRQFENFCDRVGVSVALSFVGLLFLIFLTLVSAFSPST